MGVIVNTVKSLHCNYGNFHIENKRNDGLSSCKSNGIMKSIGKSGFRGNLAIGSETCLFIHYLHAQGIV